MIIKSGVNKFSDKTLDAYTYLGINSGNEWGIKASLYSSTEILRPKSKKIDTYYKKSFN